MGDDSGQRPSRPRRRRSRRRRRPHRLSVVGSAALGRPLVDRLKGSIFHHMKELRPGSTGSTEVRMIFAFDPVREAVFLVAGDKSGQWQTWYKTAVPLADDRFQEHLSRLRETQR
ncbi:type II toxin-antitoxin system RelE/ParE family toxin [Micromonospora sp. NPDC005553]|uniref:type II toxin-antitoxin system RelE/ParE family toxin n=1 Tax=Micromonospora sp. NPDC005553 TaxID=3364232 RepID=UPI0036C81A6C